VEDEPFDDTTLIMEALLEIRDEFAGSWRTRMGKKRKRSPEERAAEEARYQDLTRRLEAAIARRKAWLAEKRREGEASA
jgi:hypothetical protein